MSVRRFAAPALAIATAALLAAGTAEVSYAADMTLVRAVKNGDRATALKLAADKAQASSAEADGTTALHWAVRHDDAELVDRLLAAGADPKVANRYGVTPLKLATQNGSAAVVERLLEAGASAAEVGIEGETVLMTAARTGDVATLRVLLTNGAEVDARESWHGQTALMWAAAQCHPGAIRELVAHGADVNARSNVEEWERQRSAEPRDKWLPPGGLTPLLFAAREGCVAAVPVLLELGAEIDTTTPDDITAPIIALINGHYDVAYALIEAGANPNLVDYTGRSALYAAVDFNTMPESNRPAPYVLDNEHTALDVARLLLERGADPNVTLNRGAPYRAKIDRGNDGMLAGGATPLLRAAKAGDLAAVKLLVAHDADPALAPPRSRIDPLMAAAGLGSAEQDTAGRYKTEEQAIATIEYLIGLGLDVNATDSHGRTAVHGAALQGYNEVIRYLAAQGAALDVEDRSGHSPLDTALGLAGGFGFTGQEGVVREDTAQVIRELMGTE
jgi:ankyrin repeat protein